MTQVLWSRGFSLHGEEVLDHGEAARRRAQICTVRAGPQGVEVDRVAYEQIDGAGGIVRVPNLKDQHVSIFDF